MPDVLQEGKNKIKKVLMVARVFPPYSSVGHSVRVIKFIKYLPTLGWLPVVLTVDDEKEYEYYPKQGSASLLSDIPQEVSIHRTSAGEPSSEFLEKERKFGQQNFLTAFIVKILGGARRFIFRNFLLPDRELSWLLFAVSLGQKIIQNEGIDAIFVTCPPHSAALIGAVLKRLTGKPLIIDFRDDWIDTPWFNSMPKFRRMIERRLENWAIKIADKVTLVTEWSQQSFIDRYPNQPKEKFVFISNGCDLEDFSFLKSMPPLLPNNSKFRIVHAGSLNDSKNWTRTPMTIFQAIQHLLQEQPNLKEKLTLAFTGFLPERQKQLVNEMGLSDVVKELGFVPRDDLYCLMKESEMLLVINYEGFATLIPGKIYEYWAVGGPPILLLSCSGAASGFIEKYKLGISVDPSDVSGIEQAILNVYRENEELAPQHISTTGIEAYDRQVLSGKLAQILSNIN